MFGVLGKCEDDACGKLGQRTLGSAKGLASVGNGIPRPLLRVPDATGNCRALLTFLPKYGFFGRVCFENTFANVFLHLKYLPALSP